MPKVRFLPSGKQLSCDPGQSIFDVGWKSGVGIQSACVGQGTCGLCRVVIVSGENQLSPYNRTEERHLGNLYHLTKLRLSCQCIVQDGADEITVEVKAKRARKKR